MFNQPLIITIHKGNFNCTIKGYNIPHERLRNELCFEIQGSEFSEARKRGFWDGMEYLYKYDASKRTEGEFPFGLIFKVIGILKEEGCAYQVIDERDKSEKTVETELNVKLRDYQEAAVEAALRRKCGILNIATGGGKCVSRSTFIPTSQGTLPIEYFSNNEYIKLKSLKGYGYTEELYDAGMQDTIKVVLNNGLEIEGTYEHPILVLDHHNHLVFRPLSQITDRDVIAIQYNNQLFGSVEVSDFFNVKQNKELSKDFAKLVSYYLEYGRFGTDKVIFSGQPIILKEIKDTVDKLFVDLKVELGEKSLELHDENFFEFFKNQTDNRIPIGLLKMKKEYLYDFIDFYIHRFHNLSILKDLQVLLLNFGVISEFVDNKLVMINANHYYQAKEASLTNDYSYLYSHNGTTATIKIKQLVSSFISTIHNFDYNIVGDLNYQHLVDMLEKYKDYEHYDTYKVLEQIIKEKYFFSGVSSITKSHNWVYDFVVPQNHSFVGNGFVNHNTKTSTGIIHRLGRKTVFYVHTIDLLDQAKNEFEQTLGVKIGQVGGGIVDIQDITVATIQTVILAFDKEYITDDSEVDKALLKQDVTDITDYKEDIRNMVEEAEVIFFDECQHLGAESFYEIAKRSFNAYFRYGLSATPWRDDGKELYIEAGLGDIIYRLSASWLIEKGYLVRPHIKFYDGMQKNASNFDNRKYQTVYKEDIVENENRNKMIVQIAMAVAKKDKTSLIIIQRKNHGEVLQKMFKEMYGMDVPFVYGGTPKKKRRESLARFRRYYEPQMVKQKNGDMVKEEICPIMIASTIADEGLDIPHLWSVVMGGGGKSTTRILQRVGRAIRLYENKELGIKKEAAFVADFHDKSKYLKDHSIIRKQTMQKESAFVFK